MLTAAAGATVNRLPVLLLPSDIFANRRPDPVLQQLEHPSEHDVSVNDAFRAVSRFFTRITRAEQLLSALPEAMRVLVDPATTGAVTVSLPEDVQAEAHDFPVEFFSYRVWRVPRAAPEPELVAAAAELLRAAERPLLIAGGGVIYSGAAEALADFATRHGVPVAETQAGKGALPWDHPLNAGPVGANGGSAANELARTADLIVAVGTRLSDFTTASMTAFQNPRVRWLSLNVTAADAHKLGALPVVCDALRGLTALGAKLHDWHAPAAYGDDIGALVRAWTHSVDELRAGQEAPRQAPALVADGADETSSPGPNGDARLAQARVLGLVNEAFGPHATVVCAAGSMPGDLLKLWRAGDPKAYHVEYGFSCMGYEIPAGLGIKLADAEREVVVMIGDGSYLMMNSEIVTAVAEGLTFTVVLVDNHGFQSIHGLQRSVGVPSFGNELRSRDPETGRLDGPVVKVDFVAHAAALGANAWGARDERELVEALARARSSSGVSVIVVSTDPERRVPSFGAWWDVPVAEVSTQRSVQEARGAYVEELARAREHRVAPAPLGSAAVDDTAGTGEDRSDR